MRFTESIVMIFSFVEEIAMPNCLPAYGCVVTYLVLSITCPEFCFLGLCMQLSLFCNYKYSVPVRFSILIPTLGESASAQHQ